VSTIPFPSQQVGDFTITAISDGYLTASLDFLSNIDPCEASRRGCGYFLGLSYAAIPRLCRYSTGLRKPSESLIRFALYQRM